MVIYVVCIAYFLFRLFHRSLMDSLSHFFYIYKIKLRYLVKIFWWLGQVPSLGLGQLVLLLVPLLLAVGQVDSNTARAKVPPADVARHGHSYIWAIRIKLNKGHIYMESATESSFPISPSINLIFSCSSFFHFSLCHS